MMISSQRKLLPPCTEEEEKNLQQKQFSIIRWYLSIFSYETSDIYVSWLISLSLVSQLYIFVSNKIYIFNLKSFF